MRVILDTNILFSALISPHNPPHRIYEAWRARRFELVTCTIQLEEIRRASRYPKFRTFLQPHRVGRMVNQLQAALKMDAIPNTPDTADPNDAWLLGLAEIARAEYLVTGDKRAGLLSRKHYGVTRIVTAAAFCRDVLRDND